ncbi:MAG: putative glycoside hydrolase [Actinobacteria bacterium]|nr:putative glycoside hydrolase [Actinomycetota bacterium]
MARKRIFSERRGTGEAFWGGKRRSLSFPELDEVASPEDRFAKRARKPAPGPVQRRLSRVKGIHLLILLVCAGVVAFLIYFLVAMLPSPIGALGPAPGSFLNNPNVDVRATLKEELKPGELTFEVDGQDLTPKTSLENKVITCRLVLADGSHKASVTLKGGGIMGKRSATWSFTVDTAPPKLVITKKKISEEKGTDRVNISFTGETDRRTVVKVSDREMPVSTKGRFSGSAAATRDKSLQITATDKAGNQSNAFIVTQKPPSAKGAHVSVFIAGSSPDMDKMIGLVERTELNALEVDLKDEYGQIAFDIDNELAQKIGSAKDIVELDGTVDKMRYRDVYSICRIVVFKDPILADGRPGLAVQDKYGGPWSEGVWVDPYSKEVWDYNLAVAEAAAKAGFNEVQFDYVRFPSDGNTSTALYPNQDGRTPGEVVNGFLSYAGEKLAPYNVFVSADLFGLTASKQGEMGIGQKVEEISRRLDFISPMVYPSHYNAGEYKIKSPEHNPHDIVYASLEDFKNVMKGTPAKLRPWLQDFSLAVTYTPDMVRRQINAVEELGIDEWLLWDPECTYSESALKPAGK